MQGYLIKEEIISPDFCQTTYSDIYTERSEALERLRLMVFVQQNEGELAEWNRLGRISVHKTEGCFVCTLGEERKYSISMLQENVLLSSRASREIYNMYDMCCKLEDLLSRLEQYKKEDTKIGDTLRQFTKSQYNDLANDPTFPEMFDEQLGKNDLYWEAYWDTLDNVARDYIERYAADPKYAAEAEEPHHVINVEL